jgi:hypothetical protein
VYPYALNNPLNRTDPHGLAIQILGALASCLASPACTAAVAAGAAATTLALGNLATNLAERLSDTGNPPPDFGDGDDGGGGDRDGQCIDAARRCLAELSPGFPLDRFLDHLVDGSMCPMDELTDRGEKCLRSMGNCLDGLPTVFPNHTYVL